MLTPRAHRHEAGGAMVAAIALLILGSFVAVAIMMSSMSSRDASRERSELSASEQLAGDAAAAYTAAYSALAAGEHNGYALSETTLRRFIDVRRGQGAGNGGDTVIRNNHGSLPAFARNVDTNTVPGFARHTVRVKMGDGRIGFWQTFAMRVPTWGQTAGGVVTIYVRTWTGDEQNRLVGQPLISKLRIRPTWFSDYQMLFDGPIKFGDGVDINGRIHSNGYRTSLFNQFNDPATTPDIITIPGSANCGEAARFTTSRGSISGPANCRSNGKARENVGGRISLLRARDVAARAHTMCGGGGADDLTVDVVCFQDGRDVSVNLSSHRANGRNFNPSTSAPRNRPDANQGAIVVATGNVELSGSLAANERVLVVASARGTEEVLGSGAAPSVTIASGGAVGAAADKSSSFGIVADGDIVIDEARACGASLRGAVLSITGALSMRTRWRMPIHVADGVLCGALLDIEASMSGHLPPTLQMIYPTSESAGFANRKYEYARGLFDNPPPLFPTAADWSVVSSTAANLDCFRQAGNDFRLILDDDRADCA